MVFQAGMYCSSCMDHAILHAKPFGIPLFKSRGTSNAMAKAARRQSVELYDCNKQTSSLLTEYILIGSRPKINSMDVQPTVKIDTCPIKRSKMRKSARS
jgi:hypothetical protein